VLLDDEYTGLCLADVLTVSGLSFMPEQMGGDYYVDNAYPVPSVRVCVTDDTYAVCVASGNDDDDEIVVNSIFRNGEDSDELWAFRVGNELGTWWNLSRYSA
jgi:hypothetical protein